VPAVNIGVLDAVLYPTTILGKLHKVYFVDLPVRLSEVLGVNDCTATYDSIVASGAEHENVKCRTTRIV